jgi:hypothetical protein
MSTTIAAVVINLLSMLLPTIGVDVGTEELTQAIQVLVAVVTGLWIWFQRVQKGDVSVVGVRH